jgi:hypothetical protein
MRTPPRTARSLTARDWLDLLRAQAALLRNSWRVRRVAIDRLALRERIDADQVTGDPVRAGALATAVRRAATHSLGRPGCLIRSLALRDLLLADGIRGVSIRIGVRRQHGEFTAHAWVVWGDAILGDSADFVAGFSEVDDPHLAPRS